MKKQTFYMLVALVVACCAHTAHAQEGGDFLQKLAEPDSLGVRSEVKMHIGAEEVIAKYNAQTSPKESFQGYRIRIFSSKGQTARADAEVAIATMEENFNIPVYFAYENPYFLVTCGNFLTHEEAIMLLSRVKRFFPKAFIVACEIPADALTHKPEPAIKPTEEEASEEVAEGATESQELDTATEEPTAEVYE